MSEIKLVDGIEMDAPGIIGVATDSLGRYREFDVSLSRVISPPGSGIDIRLGVNIAKHYNDMIRTMLSGDYQWVWILDDDHVFMPDLLMNLLARNVDVVVPLCLKRVSPYAPVLLTGKEGGYSPLGWEALAGKTGLVKLENTLLGNAGMLIRRHVIEAIEEPWFRLGQLNPELNSMDLYFAEQVQKAGLGLYLDTDNTIGHLSHVAVWPLRGEDNTYSPQIRTP